MDGVRSQWPWEGSGQRTVRKGPGPPGMVMRVRVATSTRRCLVLAVSIGEGRVVNALSRAAFRLWARDGGRACGGGCRPGSTGR
jgi:hypothetical protein